MVGFRRSRHGDRRPVGDDAATRQAPSPAHGITKGAPRPASPPGLGWAVLGVALLLGLFFLVPLGLERSAAVVPTTSADPVPQTPGPQTWVLSSTVADPGPNAGDSEAERDPKGARATGDDRGGVGDGDSDDSASVIIRVPAAGPTPEPGAVSANTTAHSAAPPGGSSLTSATAPATVPTCPQPTPTGLAPKIAEKLGADLGSTSGTGDGTGGACAG